MKILMRETKEQKWELVESNIYAAETELQELLATSPDVISMDEIRPGAGPLVAAVREFSLPVGYIDILAFTGRGDVAIIECKLARNTQAKREVIGQILDYAACLWDTSYEELDQNIQNMTNQSLADFVHGQVDGLPWDEEIFRSNIRSTLSSGNFILTIAVNEINEELNKIVRYVNSAGSPAFSFAALEMRRFQKSKIEMLVPHVFGPAHTVTKPKSENHKWDEQSLLQAIQQKDSGSEDVARKIINWGKGHVTRVWYGEGATVGSFVPILNHKGRDHQLFALYTNGAVEIYFYWYQYKPPFESEEKRLEILERLNSLQGVSLPKDSIKRRPTIKLSLLAEHDNLDKFLSIYDWVIDEIKKS